MKRRRLRNILVRVWKTITVLLLIYWWHIVDARIGSTFDFPTSGVFSDLANNLKRAQSLPDNQYAELISGQGAEGTVLGGPNQFLNYNRTFQTLSFETVGHWGWLELFVSEEELLSAAAGRVSPNEFPRQRGALHYASLAVEFCVVLSATALMYFTIDAFRPIRKT